MTMPSDMLKTFIKPMHPEGIKFVAIFGLVTLLLFWLWDPLGWIGVGLTIWCYYFFRDPKRTIPDGPNLIVAPADGTVTDITPLPDYDFIGRPAVRVGIFLSVLNVHINRAPFDGRVLDTHYKPGEFVNAQRPDCADRNESNWIGFEDPANPARRFAVRQLSGMLARKIVCTLHTGSTIRRGGSYPTSPLPTPCTSPSQAPESALRVPS